MKKSTKQLIITAIVLIIILVVVIFLGFKVMTTKPLETSEESTTDFSEDYVKYAKGIIDLVGQERDSNHVYGWGKYCNRTDGGQYNCELELIQYRYGNGDETYYASYKYMLSQIWARFHYYRVTGDKSEYEKLKEDVDALIAIIDGEIWHLQSTRFLCLYIPDLIASDLIETEYKEKLFKICFANDHERHPESIVGYSQNNHRVYDFTDLDNYGENVGDSIEPIEVSVSYDSENLYRSEEEIIYYDNNEIINNISELLIDFIDKDVISTEVFGYTSINFMRRHIMAAIDNIAKIKLLNLKNNKDEKIKTELDYLLFTWETLNWYVNQPHYVYKDADVCMIRENIQYFLEHYENKLSQKQKEKVLNKFTFESYAPYIDYCLLAGKLINQKEINTTQVFADLQAFNLTENNNEWVYGYLFNYDNGHFRYQFVHDFNSVVAGMFLLNETERE